MEQIHTKITVNGLDEGVLDNCHKCGIDCFKMPISGEGYHSGWRKKGHVSAPAVLEVVQPFTIEELTSLATICNLSVPCERCAKLAHLLQAGHYAHTWEVCPLNDAHMQAYAEQVVARVARKVELAHKHPTVQRCTKLTAAENGPKRLKPQSYAQPTGLGGQQPQAVATGPIKLNPGQPPTDTAQRPHMLPALQRQHQQQKPHDQTPSWQQQEAQRYAQTASGQLLNPMACSPTQHTHTREMSLCLYA